MLYAPDDWDSAYANAPNIPNGNRWPEQWAGRAQTFRARWAHAEIDIAYGQAERTRLDLFRPGGDARGLVVFVHGGYWVRFDKSLWSHLAAGPLAHGWAVAVPSYTLAPAARVGAIARQVAAAVAHAAGRVGGAIRLAGHSAGGHLVTRIVCTDALLADPVAARVERVVSVSGVHDLRPLLRVAVNGELGLDMEEARAESPALLEPRPGTELVAWVGAGERAEFVRQNDLLANVWRGLGARTLAVREPDRHHFDVIEGLADPRSPLTRSLLARE